MAKVEIRPHGNYTDILVNEKELDNVASYFIYQCVGMQVPVVEIKLFGHENDYLFENADVHVGLAPNRLQSAATIVRNELLKQAEWYDALVVSISKVLDDALVMSISKVMDDANKEWITQIDLATKIADRIIGLEDKPC